MASRDTSWSRQHPLIEVGHASVSSRQSGERGTMHDNMTGLGKHMRDIVRLRTYFSCLSLIFQLPYLESVSDFT